jgi:hypothetical protein
LIKGLFDDLNNDVDERMIIPRGAARTISKAEME